MRNETAPVSVGVMLPGSSHLVQARRMWTARGAGGEGGWAALQALPSRSWHSGGLDGPTCPARRRPAVLSMDSDPLFAPGRYASHGGVSAWEVSVFSFIMFQSLFLVLDIE